MEIIRSLENKELRIYTGAIGYITPNSDMYLNVPMRTLLIRGGSGEMGVGWGIVWDSTPQGEWDEGMLKARFLTSMAKVSAYYLRTKNSPRWLNAELKSENYT